MEKTSCTTLNHPLDRLHWEAGMESLGFTLEKSRDTGPWKGAAHRKTGTEEKGFPKRKAVKRNFGPEGRTKMKDTRSLKEG